MSKTSTVTWFKFPNGKVWPMNQDGLVYGVTTVSDYEDLDLEARLDAIVEESTGSIVGLEDFSYRYLGESTVEFAGFLSDDVAPRDEDDEDVEDGAQPIDIQSPEFLNAIKAQFRLNDAQANHAIKALRLCGPATGRDDELVLPIVGRDRAIHCPMNVTEPGGMYVRIVVAGALEVEFVPESALTTRACTPLHAALYMADRVVAD